MRTGLYFRANSTMHPSVYDDDDGDGWVMRILMMIINSIHKGSMIMVSLMITMRCLAYMSVSYYNSRHLNIFPLRRIEQLERTQE